MDGPLDSDEVAEVNAVQVALRTGWTLDYIRDMDTAEFYRVVKIIGAIDAAEAHKRTRG